MRLRFPPVVAPGADAFTLGDALFRRFAVPFEDALADGFEEAFEEAFDEALADAFAGTLDDTFAAPAELLLVLLFVDIQPPILTVSTH